MYLLPLPLNRYIMLSYCSILCREHRRKATWQNNVMKFFTLVLVGRYLKDIKKSVCHLSLLVVNIVYVTALTEKSMRGSEMS